MVPKLITKKLTIDSSFRAVLFRMVPKQEFLFIILNISFRAVLFRMVPKRLKYQRDLP